MRLHNDIDTSGRRDARDNSVTTNRARVSRVALVVVALLTAATASAADCEWTGLGADAKWSTRENWRLCPAGVPGNGDSVTFLPNRPRAANEIDIPDLTLAKVALNGTSGPGAPWHITGLGVRLTESLTATDAAAFLAPITLAAGPFTVLTDSAQAVVGSLELGPLDMNGFGFNIRAFFPTSIGAMSGLGGVFKTGGASLTLADSTFRGPLQCDQGSILVETPNALGSADPTDFTLVLGTCRLLLTRDVTLDESIGLGGDGEIRTSPDVKAVLTAGLVAPFGGFVSVAVPADSQLEIKGPLSPANGGFFVNGLGTVVLSGPGGDHAGLIVSESTVRLGAANVLPDTAGLLLFTGATLDLNNFNETIGGLEGDFDTAVQLGAGTLTIDVFGENASFGYSGTIEGTGSVVKTGAGVQAFSDNAANTYTGTTTVRNGTLRLEKRSGVPAIAGPLVVNGGVVEVGTDSIAHTSAVTLNAPGRLVVTGTDTATFGSLDGSGEVAGTFDVGGNNASTTFTGTISSEVWTKRGTGTLTLNHGGVSLLANLVGGTLVANARLEDVVISEAATLSGIGPLGPLVADTEGRGVAVVSPGPEAGPGILRVAAATLSHTILSIDLNGLAAGAGHDRLEVTAGDLALQVDARLRVARNFGPAAGQSFTIVAVAPGHKVTGTFVGLPEGAEALLAGQRFTITYRGGDGNDVVLTALDGPPLITSYLAEGATSSVFDTEIALLNPSAFDTTAHVSFLRQGFAPATIDIPVASHRRVTLDPKTVLGAGTSEFSTTVAATERLVVDRTLHWAQGQAYGAHVETAVTAPALTWFLAEGATHSGLNVFYLLQNPNASAAEVRVRYLRPSGGPLEKQYSLPPQSRTNIWVNVEDFPGLGTALAATDVSAAIEVLNNQPIIVERAVYAPVPGQILGAGHASAGVTTPATEWFLAEGATGSFMDLFVLIANPSDTAAQVEATYFLPDGATIVKTYAVAANSRYSIWVDHDDPRLADTAVSTRVRSTNGVPVVVDRAMWWPDGAWYEGHNSSGATTTGTAWGLAAGAVDTAHRLETYILVANPSDATASAKVTLYFEDGAAAERTFEILPRSRFNVVVAAEFPQAAGRRFGAVVESLGATPTPIVVERSMYWDAVGQVWAAGTNALAVKLQ